MPVGKPESKQFTRVAICFYVVFEYVIFLLVCRSARCLAGCLVVHRPASSAAIALSLRGCAARRRVVAASLRASLRRAASEAARAGQLMSEEEGGLLLLTTDEQASKRRTQGTTLAGQPRAMHPARRRAVEIKVLLEARGGKRKLQAAVATARHHAHWTRHFALKAEEPLSPYLSKFVQLSSLNCFTMGLTSTTHTKERLFGPPAEANQS
jgi:hypothetical protein